MKEKLKKVNCASLPPYHSVPKHPKTAHQARVNYVLKMWAFAHTNHPTENMDPVDYGWQLNENGILVPLWHEGSALPTKGRQYVDLSETLIPETPTTESSASEILPTRSAVVSESESDDDYDD